MWKVLDGKIGEEFLLRPQTMGVIGLSWFDAGDRWCLRFKFLDRYQNISATMVRKTMMEDNDEVLKLIVPSFVYIHKEEIKEYLRKAI